MSGACEEIFELIRRIPRGRVATYGQIARLLGRPNGARQVGYALAALPEESDVPWHRVVNAKGEISSRTSAKDCENIQCILLEDEGVVFDKNGRIDLARFLWAGY